MKPFVGTVICLLIICYAQPAAADWSMYKKGELRSENRNTFRIDRGGNGPVRAWLVLRTQVAGAFESRLPLYRVDTGKVHDLQSALKVQTDKNKNRWIRWQIDDGTGEIGTELRELMNGTEIVFQYYLPGGEIQESIFPLKGAKEAIGDIMGKN